MPCWLARPASTMWDMDDWSPLSGSRYWRLSVWGFRVAVLAVVVMAGSVVSLLTIDAGSWFLFGAICVVVASDIAVFSGFALMRRNLPKPRPSFKSFRQTLIHDSLHGWPQGAKRSVEKPAVRAGEEQPSANDPRYPGEKLKGHQ